MAAHALSSKGILTWVAVCLWSGIACAQTTSSPPSPSQTAPPIPVKVSEATTRDFPLYSRSIGTVQGYNTASIVSRVDGELQRIGFREGQDVRAGDLLAQI